MTTALDPTKVISPKIVATGVVYIIGAAILAAAAALTPDLFDFAGPWGVVLYSAVVGASAQLAGYLKTDPLRVSRNVYTDADAARHLNG